MSNASVAAAVRGAQEMFDEVARVQHTLRSDFDRHDARQQRFDTRFAQDMRRHHRAISRTACDINSSPSSDAVLFAKPTSDEVDEDDPCTPARRGSVLDRQLQRLQNPASQRVREHLKCFHLPSDVTTDVICDTCGAFRGAMHVEPLPDAWEEHVCEDNGRRYFYDNATQQVLWSPPRNTSPFSVFVFNRTNSVTTLCHCIPSHERRQRCMQKFRAYALESARKETEARNRQLHGALKTLAHSLIKKE